MPRPRSLNLDLNASRDFFENWNLKLLYRYYDYDNETPRTVFDGYVQFHSGLDDGSRASRSRTPTPATTSARRSIGTSPTATGFELSYHRKTYEREFREVESSDEDIVKLSFDSRLTERFTVRASYELGDRTIDGYLVEAQMFSFFEPTPFNNQPGLRKYDEAERDYEDWEASVFILAHRRLEPQPRHLRARRGLRREPVRADRRRHPAVERRSLLLAERGPGLLRLRPPR